MHSKDLTQIAAYVPMEVAKRLRAAAKAQDRSMSYLITAWVTEKLAENEKESRPAN